MKMKEIFIRSLFAISFASCAPQGKSSDTFQSPDAQGRTVMAAAYGQAEAEKANESSNQEGRLIIARAQQAKEVCATQDPEAGVGVISFRDGQDTVTDILLCYGVNGQESLAGYQITDPNGKDTQQEFYPKNRWIVSTKVLPDSEGERWTIKEATNGNETKMLWSTNGKETFLYGRDQTPYLVKGEVTINDKSKPHFQPVSGYKDVFASMSFQEAGRRTTATPTPLTVEQAVTATINAPATKTATMAATATETKVPTPTVDAETAAIIREMKAKVGYKVTDWIEPVTFDLKRGTSNVIKVRMVITGIDTESVDKELFDGNGKAVGKIKFAYTAVQPLNGLTRYAIPMYIEDYQEPGCFYYYQKGHFDCNLLTPNVLKPERMMMGEGEGAVFSKFGQVVTLFVLDQRGYDPKVLPDNSSGNDFFPIFMEGKTEAFRKWVETGDNTDLGNTLIITDRLSYCKNKPLCQDPKDDIYITKLSEATVTPVAP